MTAFPQHMMFAAGSLVCACIGSVHDVRERRIPNLLTGPAILAGLMLHLAFGSWAGLGNAALAGLLGGGLFFLLFLAGGMGAGDVKLMAAVGCCVGLAPLRLIMVATVLVGGMFAVAVSLYNGRLGATLRNVVALMLHHQQHGFEPHPELNLENPETLRLPYALPIAAGCLVAVCTLAWEGRE